MLLEHFLYALLDRGDTFDPGRYINMISRPDLRDLEHPSVWLVRIEEDSAKVMVDLHNRCVLSTPDIYPIWDRYHPGGISERIKTMWPNLDTYRR